MADETEKSFKAFKSWQEETEKANETVKDFYDHLEGAFDISKKITNQYDKVYKSIQAANNELANTRNVIKEHLAIIEQNKTQYQNIGKEIEANQNRISILNAEQSENNIILEEKQKLLEKQEDFTKSIEKYTKSI